MPSKLVVAMAQSETAEITDGTDPDPTASA